MVTCKRITVPFAAEASKEAKIQVPVDNLEDAVKRNSRKEAAFLILCRHCQRKPKKESRAFWKERGLVKWWCLLLTKVASWQ